MRALAFLLALTAAATAGAAAPAPAPDPSVGLVRVLHGWRDADSFKHISEYFSGRENTGGEIVVRTHPEQRAGYYFLIRLANAGAPRAIQVHLQLVPPGAPRPQPFDFPVTLPAGETVFDFGLTGTDWAAAKAHPVAWKLEILDTTGRLLATTQSYLWEKPAGN